MRVLTVVAHPDDHSRGADGTMVRMPAAGHEACVCILAGTAPARHGHTEQQACAKQARHDRRGRGGSRRAVHGLATGAP